MFDKGEKAYNRENVVFSKKWWWKRASIYSATTFGGLPQHLQRSLFLNRKRDVGGAFSISHSEQPYPQTPAGDPQQQPTGGESCCADYLRFSLRLPPPLFPLHPSSPRSACSGSRANPRVRSPAARQRLLGVVRQRRRRLRPSPASADGARKAAAPAVPPQAERLGAGL